MNSRRKFLIQGSVAATALLAAKPFKSFARYSSPLSFLNSSNSVTLLHTYGMHNAPANCAETFQQTAGMIATFRKENNNSLLFDTGNSFCGENNKILQLLQSLGYDAILPGNLDVEGNRDLLKKNFYNTTIPVIASNYDITDTGLRTRILPYKIINKANMRIGIIGAGSFSSDVFIYKEPVKEINALATTLKEERHCNLVICLSNLGYKNNNTVDDCTLAFQSKNVDVIIGSQSISGPVLPSVILNKNRQEVVINNAGHRDLTLGRIEIGFDERKKKNRITFNNIHTAGNW